MVVFKVSKNINIKTTDGTLVQYHKLRNQKSLILNSLYVCTNDEHKHLNNVMKKVGPEYKTTSIDLKALSKNRKFPKRYHYLKSNFKQEKISIAFLGNFSDTIGSVISSSTALRLLYNLLSKEYNEVIFDIYIEASENSFYSRDKKILETQEYINKVEAMALNVSKFCEYDFYVNHKENLLLNLDENLSYVDMFLNLYGIPSDMIPSSYKFNSISTKRFNISDELKTRMKELQKSKQKLLLYHPYSSALNRSIPKSISIKLLKKLIEKTNDYKIITVLDILKDDELYYDNLTKYSQNIETFIYIISCMDKIITTDTSTYHISDAFFIPTVVFFNEGMMQKRIENYKYTKGIELKDKSLNLSKFNYDNETLTLYQYDAWKSIKISKVIKLLETI